MNKSEKEYTVIVERIEELLSVPENIENPASSNYDNLLNKIYHELGDD